MCPSLLSLVLQGTRKRSGLTPQHTPTRSGIQTCASSSANLRSEIRQSGFFVRKHPHHRVPRWCAFCFQKTTPASLVGVVSCRQNPPIFQGPRRRPLRQVVNKHLACLDARTQGLQCSFRSYGQETLGVRENRLPGGNLVLMSSSQP